MRNFKAWDTILVTCTIIYCRKANALAIEWFDKSRMCEKTDLLWPYISSLKDELLKFAMPAIICLPYCTQLITEGDVNIGECRGDYRDIHRAWGVNLHWWLHLHLQWLPTRSYNGHSVGGLFEKIKQKQKFATPKHQQIWPPFWKLKAVIAIITRAIFDNFLIVARVLSLTIGSSLVIYYRNF